MPNKYNYIAKWSIELVSSDGSSITQTIEHPEAKSMFRFFVNQIIDFHSSIREVNLYDTRHKLYKSYKQYF